MRRTMRALAAFAAVAGIAKGEGFDASAFRTPENVYSPAYFWMWNSRLDVAKLNAQLDDMVAHGMRSVCIHPFPKGFRPGHFNSEMDPDYLTDEYLAIYGKVIDHAAELGMNAWLYDEGGWPSGGACGRMAAADANGVFRQRYYGREKAGDAVNRVWTKPYGTGRNNMPSVLEPGATEAFVNMTHEAYKRVVGRHFGKTIKFTFMDEPMIPSGGVAGPNLGWASDFAAEFKARKGYDVVPKLNDLIDDKVRCSSTLAPVRIDFNDVMGQLFAERFHGVIRSWCAKNGLLSSGHMDGDDIPEAARRYGYGTLMRCLRGMDVPGVDVIWRQLYPWNFGNAGAQPPFPRYASSVAHQAGGRLALSESFGIYGDSFTPGRMKWLVDYQMVRGINLFVFGYYSVSNAGQWMTLFEPHSGPVVPWWDHERPFFEYVARTASLLAQGEPVTRTAVFFDERGFLAGGADTEVAARQHYAVATALDRMNCEYAFVEDSALAAADVRDGRLVVGHAAYATFVVPTSKWMSDGAKAKLEAFRRAGGQVLRADEVGEARPTLRVDGHHQADWLRVAKRVKGRETLYFVVNEKGWDMWGVPLVFDEKGPVVVADPETGVFRATNAADGRLKWNFPPFSSALFIVNGQANAPALPDFPGEWGYEPPYTIKDGWTLQPLTRYSAGRKDFVIENLNEAARPVSLGDWRPVLGKTFSGRAVYRTTFEHPADEPRWLDLGKVGWSCSVKLNGRDVGTKFFGPYRWHVNLKKGANTLEISVANMLCNALPDEVRDRVARDFPPLPSYDVYQRGFDRENNESGLFGPVTLR